MIPVSSHSHPVLKIMRPTQPRTEMLSSPASGTFKSPVPALRDWARGCVGFAHLPCRTHRIMHAEAGLSPDALDVRLTVYESTLRFKEGTLQRSIRAALATKTSGSLESAENERPSWSMPSNTEGNGSCGNGGSLVRSAKAAA